ncbi:MAG: DinB family protein [Phycisphaerae bacterium]|nr:DinB family protein [Gemmatimonadaceae bacterium]
MNSSESIADSLRRTLTGPMWHGDAVNQLLSGVPASDAANRPVPGAHTIWELVLHMTAWANIAHMRLASKPQREPTAAEDWPPLTGGQSIEAWSDAQMRLTEAYERLAQKTETLDRDALQAQVPGHDYSVRTMLIGVVEHGAYHGGQIGLLKRALVSE